MSDVRAVRLLVAQRATRLTGAIAAWPWAEIAAAAALLAGWALLTWGIALLTAWPAWPISGGLLCLTLFGWRFLYQVGRDGLYALTREKP